MRRRDFLGLLAVAPLGCGGRDETMAHSLKPDYLQLIPGMRQDFATELAPPGTLRDAINCRYTRQGSLSARRGCDAVASTTHGNVHEIQNSGGLVLASSIGDAPCLGTEQGKMFALDTTGGLFNFSGNFSTVIPLRRRKGLISERSGSIAQAKYGIAANSAGYVLVASCDGSNSLNVSIEAEDGTPLWYESALATATKCLAISQNNVLILVSQNSTTLTAHTFTITNGAIAYSAATVGTLQSASQYWDICEGPTTSWYLVYQVLATRLDVDRYNTGLSFQGTLAQITVSGNCPCSVFYDSTNARVWAGWWNDPGVTGEVRLRAWNTSGTALCAVTTLATSTFARPPLIGMPGSVGSAFFTYNRLNSRTVYGYVTLPGNPANVCTSTSYSAWWVFAMSKPDANQRSWCVTVSGKSTGEFVIERFVLLRWNADASFGSSMLELSGPMFDSQVTGLPIDFFASASNRSGLLTFAVYRILRPGLGLGLRSLDVYQYEDVTRHPWRSTVKLGNSLIVSGQPTAFFGNSSGIGNVSGPVVEPRQGGVEIGFPLLPDITSATEQATGSLTALGTYSYQVVLEWISPSGERHRSRPSDPVSVTLTGGNFGVALTITAPNWGQRWDDTCACYPVAHVYRTENGGQVHYRVTPGSGAPIANDATDGLVDYIDELSDADMLVYGEALYVDQALCDYDLAPSCRFMWRDERRIWTGGLWDEDQVCCSLDQIPEQPTEFSDFAGLNGPAFRISIGEPCTGGEYQDGVNYLFAKNAIYAVSGNGPDRQGNGEFSPPRVITKETGCIDYRSVKATSRGIFFRSARGLELLPRGGGLPIFIGAQIQDLMASWPDVLSVAIHADTTERTARFLLAESGAQSGSVVAVFDLDVSGWSYDSHVSDKRVLGEWPSGTFLGHDDQTGTDCGLLDTDDSLTITDDGEPVMMTLRTNWISPFGLGGYGRVNSAQFIMSRPVLNDTIAAQAVVVGGHGDNFDTIGRNWTFTGSFSGPIAREMTIAKESSSMWFQIQLTRVGSGYSPAVHAIALELGALSGTRRNPASSQ